jgi:hypothetical protein
MFVFLVLQLNKNIDPVKLIWENRIAAFLLKLQQDPGWVKSIDTII